MFKYKIEVFLYQKMKYFSKRFRSAPSKNGDVRQQSINRKKLSFEWPLSYVDYKCLKIWRNGFIEINLNAFKQNFFIIFIYLHRMKSFEDGNDRTGSKLDVQRLTDSFQQRGFLVKKSLRVGFWVDLAISAKFV